MDGLKDDSLPKERVEQCVKSLSKAINLIESVNETMTTLCKVYDWNDDVAYQIGEAAAKLGYSLATLNRWFDVIKDDED